MVLFENEGDNKTIVRPKINKYNYQHKGLMQIFVAYLFIITKIGNKVSLNL